MIKKVWINLPVKNIEISKKFFIEIGFSFNEQYGTHHSTCLLVGEVNFVVMLFESAQFASFIQNAVTDTAVSSEILISIDAESRDEVDEFAKKVEQAGGTVFAKPAENQGWMYGCGFTDLDGHRWNMLYMDFSKVPK